MALISKKRRKNKLSADEFQGVVYKMASDAALYIDHDIAPKRDLAQEMYDGRPLGNEEDGRSQVVMTTIRDTVNAVLPSLLRVFAGSEMAVEFVPNDETEVQMAADATLAINDIFWRKNSGFAQVLEPAFYDALVKKTGILYWWFEERERVREYVYNGLTEEEMSLILAQDPDMEVVAQTPCDDDEDDAPTSHQADPSDPTHDPAVMGAIQQGIEQHLAEAPEDHEFSMVIHIEQKFDFRVKRITRDKLVRVQAIPPEQFLINRSATCIEDALLVGRRQVVTISDLVAIGFDFDEILENGGSAPLYGVSSTNMEAEVRDPSLLWGQSDTYGDDALRPVIYNELYVRIDRDGDGIAELYRVQTIGEEQYVLHAEIWEDDLPPMSLLCPFPTPHKAIGMSLADRLIDLQRINSQVWRHTLDAFSGSIHPRTAVLEGAVNLDDVMNTEIGAIIRMRQPGAVQEFVKSFNGQASMDLMTALENIKAERTGVSMASQGLDPEVLQSTTATAVAATTAAADMTVEMIARRFAENGIKQMFAGLLRTMCRHIDEPLNVTRPDGSMTQVDPRTINPNLLLTTNVGLGKGKDQDRLGMLGQVLTYQIQMLTQVGITPIVGPEQLRNTLSSMLQIAGIKDVSRYFKPVPAGWQPAPPQPQQNPQMMLAQGQVQASMQKVQNDAAAAQRDHEFAIVKMQMDQQLAIAKMQADMQMKREQMAQERVLQLASLQAQYGSQLQQAQMDAEIEIEKTHIGAVSDMVSQQADLGHQATQAHLDRHAALEAQALQSTHDHATDMFTPPAPPAVQPGAPGAL
jgi:hypothetical protein